MEKSARNRLKGQVLVLQKESLAAMFGIQVTVPAAITALISQEAVEDSNVNVGDEVEAVVKL